MISQNLSEFALHARAIMGIPVTKDSVSLRNPSRVSASRAVVVEGDGEVMFSNVAQALSVAHTDMRLFGKPEVHGHRRMAVLLAQSDTVDEARNTTQSMSEKLSITVR